MEQIIRIGLPIYLVVFFGIAFVLKSFLVAKRIGKSPLVLPKDDSAYGLIGFYFKITMAGLFIYAIIYSIFPDWYEYFMNFQFLEFNYSLFQETQSSLVCL